LPNGTIVVDHVWKRFRADEVEASISSKVKNAGKILKGHHKEWRWVLKDIDFKIEPGATVALTGVNGSGKSTLLRVISQVSYQSTGSIDVRGRIGALLELRSGIHPQLTGHENIFLFGAILGLSRPEIAARFDDIVEFSGLADAINRQVKYYSSGMAVRLGFSIAAFLEPEVLLVDEVLAVGDASFQQQCLRKISEVVGSGATLVFVSHDLAAVEAMCDRTIWLSDAIMRADGPTREVLRLYRQQVETTAELKAQMENDPIKIVSVDVASSDGNFIASGGGMTARIVFDAPAAGEGAFILGVTEGPAMPIFVVRRKVAFPQGRFELTCNIEHVPLPRGGYFLWAAAQFRHSMRGTQQHLVWRSVAPFEVFGARPSRPPRGVMVLSPVYVGSTWQIA
jgi:ABC-2 type transport system ATP-binding protein